MVSTYRDAPGLTNRANGAMIRIDRIIGRTELPSATRLALIALVMAEEPILTDTLPAAFAARRHAAEVGEYRTPHACPVDVFEIQRSTPDDPCAAWEMIGDPVETFTDAQAIAETVSRQSGLTSVRVRKNGSQTVWKSYTSPARPDQHQRSSGAIDHDQHTQCR